MTTGLVVATLTGRSPTVAVRERTGIDYCGVCEVVRLTLVSHAMKDAVTAGRFPVDEPLNSARPKLFAICKAMDIKCYANLAYRGARPYQRIMNRVSAKSTRQRGATAGRS